MKTEVFDLPPEIFQKHLETLEIEYPFSKYDLKKAFCKRANETHPDHHGKSEDFKSVKEAFDSLSYFCQEYREKQTEKTIEGQNIFDLGKGLGKLTNAKKCDDCKGLGYHTTNREVIVSFDNCPICKGEGQSRFYDNYKKIMVRSICMFCFGTGKVNVQTKTQKQSYTCRKCKGSGEIEIFNPVLKKGVFNQGKTVKQVNKKEYCSCGAILKNGKCWRCK